MVLVLLNVRETVPEVAAVVVQQDVQAAAVLGVADVTALVLVIVREAVNQNVHLLAAQVVQRNVLDVALLVAVLVHLLVAYNV